MVNPLQSDPEGVDICGVCQEEIQEPGELSDCPHRFCFECITEWAKVESTCPFCRARFTSIKHIRHRPGGERHVVAVKRVAHTNQVYNPDEEEVLGAAGLGRSASPEPEYACVICQQDDNDHCLLLCDGCDSACHTYCCGLDVVPDSAWFCAVCSEERRSQGGHQQRSSRRRGAATDQPQPSSGGQGPSPGGRTVSGRRRRRFSSSIVQSASRAARNATRNSARGRRSARGRSGEAASAGPPPSTAAAPVEPPAILSRNLHCTRDLQADLSLMRSNWRGFQTQGFEPSTECVGRQTASAGGRSALHAQQPETGQPQSDAQQQSWVMAERALRALQESRRRPSSRQGNRSAALDHVRGLIRQRRNGVPAARSNRIATASGTPWDRHPSHRQGTQTACQPAAPLHATPRVARGGDTSCPGHLSPAPRPRTLPTSPALQASQPMQQAARGGRSVGTGPRPATEKRPQGSCPNPRPSKFACCLNPLPCTPPCGAASLPGARMGAVSTSTSTPSTSVSTAIVALSQKASRLATSRDVAAAGPASKLANQAAASSRGSSVDAPQRAGPRQQNGRAAVCDSRVGGSSREYCNESSTGPSAPSESPGHPGVYCGSPATSVATHRTEMVLRESTSGAAASIAPAGTKDCHAEGTIAAELRPSASAGEHLRQHGTAQSASGRSGPANPTPPHAEPSCSPSVAKQAKDAAFLQVKAQLKPLYDCRGMSREEYKRVAQAATHTLYNRAMQRASGRGAPHSEEAVLAAIREARGGVDSLPDGQAGPAASGACVS